MAADAKMSAAIEKAIPTPAVSASGLLGAQAFGQAGIPLDPIVLMNVILPHLKQGAGGYLNSDASKLLIIDALAGAMYTLIRSDSVGQTIKNISKNSLKNFINICDTGKYPFTNTKGQTYNRNAGYTEATRALYSAMAQLTPQIYDSKMARGFFESKGTDAQCKAAPLCNEYKLGQTICYIHNKPFGEKGQCEHIKPVYDANRHLFLFQTNKSYTSLEQSIMNLEYYWSCNCCNKTKNDDLWFKQDPDTKEWKIDENKLRETLENINNNIPSGKEQCTKKHELVVTNRMTAIKNRYLRHNLAIINAQIAYLQEKIPGNKKNMLNARIIYHFISICRILSKVSIDAIKSIDDKIVEKSAALAPNPKQSATKKTKTKGGANVNIITQYNKANMIKMQKMHGGMTPEMIEMIHQMRGMDILLDNITHIIFLSRTLLEYNDFVNDPKKDHENDGFIFSPETIKKNTEMTIKLHMLINTFITPYKDTTNKPKYIGNIESILKLKLPFSSESLESLYEHFNILFENYIKERFILTAKFENKTDYVSSDDDLKGGFKIGPNIIPFITQNHREFNEVNAEILINCIIVAPYLDSYEIFINEEENTLFDNFLEKTFKELYYNSVTAERNNVYGNAATARPMAVTARSMAANAPANAPANATTARPAPPPSVIIPPGMEQMYAYLQEHERQQQQNNRSMQLQEPPNIPYGIEQAQLLENMPQEHNKNNNNNNNNNNNSNSNSNNNEKNKKRLKKLRQEIRQKQLKEQQLKNNQNIGQADPGTNYMSTKKRGRNAIRHTVTINGTPTYLPRLEIVRRKEGLPINPRPASVKAKRGFVNPVSLNTSKQLTTSNASSNAAMAGRGGGSHKKLKQKIKSKKAKHATLHTTKARSASRRLRRVLRATHTTRKTASRASR